MKKILFKVMPPLLLLLIAPTIPVIGVDGQIVGVNASQLDSFHQALQKALTDQETRVRNLTAQATNRTNAPMSIDKVALGNAMIMLDVKRTLVANFWDNPVTQNAGFQQRLLQILNKDLITEGDLAELQNAADQIRAFNLRINMQQQQVQQQQAAQPQQSTVVSPNYSSFPQTTQPAQTTTTQPYQTTQPAQTSQPLPIVLPPSPQPGVIPAPAPVPAQAAPRRG
jgi:hypothetical protein